jgi:citrate synthase
VTSQVAAGLEGVIATTTRVMWLDPSSGTLAYRGVPIEELAGSRSFEEVAHLLITGTSFDGDLDGYAGFANRLRTSRHLPGQVVELIRDLSPSVHPTRQLRAGISALGCHEMTASDELSGDRHWRELRIVGQVAAVAGEVASHRAGRPTPELADDVGLAEAMLRCLTGRSPDPEDIALLDLIWVLYAAHGLDAPTFTSMIVASCLADPYSNIVAGLSALRGHRQGGASEMVLRQLRELKSPSDAEDFVRRTLAEGGMIAGFGHRSYHMPDPRVVILRRELAALARRRGRGELFEAARALEAAASTVLAARGVFVNLNFYAAPIFSLLGADDHFAPCLFAVGRMAGLVALVREAIDSIRLIRPLSRYVGTPERRIEGRERR